MRVKPLDDILVIEIDSWMASPSAGAILADLGARVIKIEPPDGDPMRDMGRPPKIEGAVKNIDLQFDVDNRGKESLIVDLTTDEGVETVHTLCRHANVFMCNLLMERQEKYRLDPLRTVCSQSDARTRHAHGVRDDWTGSLETRLRCDRIFRTVRPVRCHA